MTASLPGMVVVRCNASTRDVVARLESVLHARGIPVFAVIDHMAGAVGAGLALRPTTLVVFGDPRVGTKLMQESQTAGFDLPLKALVWSDANDETWLGYTDIHWVAQRHDLSTNPAIAAIEKGLSNIAAEASGGSAATKA